MIIRVVLLQVYETDCFYINQSSCKNDISQYADLRQIDTREILANRGSIYDRNGEILALSLPKKTLCINFKELYQPYFKNKVDMEPLLKITGISKKTFNKLLRKNKNKVEYYLKRKISQEDYLRIKEFDVPHVYFIDEYDRIYLSGEYFSNVIGFTDIDDNGISGIELAKDNILRSKNGVKKIRKDNLGRSVEFLEVIKEAKSGEDIYLSFDKRIQYIGYSILKDHVLKSKADSASLVLIKSKTGEIISMINYPSFNPDNRSEYKGERIKNKSASSLFEPGSTIKPFIAYVALESGSIQVDDEIDTSIGLKLSSEEKIIRDYKNLGTLSLSGVIEKSSNVGAAVIAKSNKKQDIYNTLNKLSFSDNLFIDIPGIQNGTIKDYNLWDEALHGTVGYGYGLSTTLLHLANAYNIIANNGKRIQLTYLKSDENIEYERLLNTEKMIMIKEMLKEAVEKGTGSKAKIKNYSVAGKTGTVRIRINGKYSSEHHNTLFVGMVPASNPQYVSAIIIRNPKNQPVSGGKNAAPIFSEFMSHSLNLLEVYPDVR